MNATVTPIHSAPEPAGAGLNSVQLCEHAGITYRQSDYWTRAGYLSTLIPPRGSGSSNRYSHTEAEVARVVKVLLDCGFMLPPAFGYARRVVEHAEVVELAGGLVRIGGQP